MGPLLFLIYKLFNDFVQAFFQLGRFFLVDLYDQASATIYGKTHYQTLPLFDDFHRSIASTRFHCCHSFLTILYVVFLPPRENSLGNGSHTSIIPDSG